MSINWYPGHMHKARKAMLKALNKIDILIEIVDARLPYSSQNPIIQDWRSHKPTLVILNKSDLADPVVTKQWQKALEQKSHMKTIAYNKQQTDKINSIESLCRDFIERDVTTLRPINAMIAGIPNVGKSTMINALAHRIIAKVGNEPAVTKNIQKVTVHPEFILHDTPGILWPKIENPHSAYRLAMIGSIRNTAIDFEDIACYAAESLMARYPERLSERYQLNELPEIGYDCLAAIGAKRGAKQSGGRVNMHKAAELFIQDLRNGTLGRLSLETPEMIANECQQDGSDVQNN